MVEHVVRGMWEDEEDVTWDAALSHMCDRDRKHDVRFDETIAEQIFVDFTTRRTCYTPAR